MAKKIVGLTCGMKHGNSEDLLSCLMGAGELRDRV